MKKVLFLAAMLAVAASCSKTESVDAVNYDNQIGFEALNYKSTRVANDAGDDYKVYAQYSTAVGGEWYMGGVDYDTNDDAVVPTGGSAPLFFWPQSGAGLDFYAYAPASVAASPVAPTASVKGSISVAYEVDEADQVADAKAQDAQVDFTVATPVVNQNSETNAGTVKLAFNHMLAKVSCSISLEKEVADAGFYFDADAKPHFSFRVKDTEGQVTISDVEDQTTSYLVGKPVFETTAAAAGTKVWYTGSKAAGKAGATGATNFVGSSYHVVPQVSTGTRIYIGNIKIINSKDNTHFYGSCYYTLKDGDITGTETNQEGASYANQLLQGKHYNFSLVISLDGKGTPEPEPTPDPTDPTDPKDPDPTPDPEPQDPTDPTDPEDEDQDPIFPVIKFESTLVDWEDVVIGLENYEKPLS